MCKRHGHVGSASERQRSQRHFCVQRVKTVRRPSLRPRRFCLSPRESCLSFATSPVTSAAFPKPGGIIMFRTKLVLGMAAVCLVATAARAEEENPFKKAKVGDWSQYATKTVMPAATIESEMKQTVTKKTDTEVTYEMKMKAN